MGGFRTFVSPVLNGQLAAKAVAGGAEVNFMTALNPTGPRGPSCDHWTVRLSVPNRHSDHRAGGGRSWLSSRTRLRSLARANTAAEVHRWQAETRRRIEARRADHPPLGYPWASAVIRQRGGHSRPWSSRRRRQRTCRRSSARFVRWFQNSGASYRPVISAPTDTCGSDGVSWLSCSIRATSARMAANT